MWHQLWIPVLIPTLIIKSNCDVNRTDTDVFVRHSHAEADYMNRHEPIATVTEKPVDTTTAVRTTVRVTKPPTTRVYDEATDNVMFIPNKEAQRREEEDDEEANGYKIRDIMMMKSMNDVMNKDFHVEKLVDNNPNEDIMFITGKNHDYEKQPRPKDNYNYRRNDDDVEEYIDEDFLPRPKLNCTDLDCNNTIRSICGAKLVNKEWRYRLFLNDCYFRKVNCGFKYEVNRYRQVIGDRCKTIGANYHERAFFRPKPFLDKLEEAKDLPPRTSPSRRSMTINYNGQFCSHLCPVSCPEEYDPQCAISGTGQRRVFLNHCKMDHNSCFYGVVWHKRPLAECVGGKKADLRQNRGFIGWMQRVGIVDNKGRLVLE